MWIEPGRSLLVRRQGRFVDHNFLHTEPLFGVCRECLERKFGLRAVPISKRPDDLRAWALDDDEDGCHPRYLSLFSSTLYPPTSSPLPLRLALSSSRKLPFKPILHCPSRRNLMVCQDLDE